MKKVLIVYSGFASNGGGVVTHAENLKSIIKEMGNECEIFSMNNLPFIIKYIFPLIERIVNFFVAPKGFIIRMKLTEKYFKYFLPLGYDCYFFEDIYTVPKKFLNRSYIFIHALKTDNMQSFKKVSKRQLSILNSLQKKLILSQKDKIFIVSQEYKKRISKLYNIENIKIFNNFFSREIKEENLIYKKNNNILFVGNLEKGKNPLFLIEVLKILDKQKVDFNMFFIGRERDIKIKELNNLIEKNSLQEKVKVLGMIKHNEVLDYMKKSKILVLPSLQETFGYVFLEAKVYGCKVIANKGLTVPKELIDYELPLESEKWVNIILKLLSEQNELMNERKSIVNYGKKEAINKLKNII